MKKEIITIFLILLTGLGFSQNPQLARFYFQNRNFEKAAKEYEGSLKTFKKAFGSTDTTEYMGLLFFTGESYLNIGNLKKAEKYFSKAKSIYEKINATNCNTYCFFISKLEDVYQVGNEPKKTEELYFSSLGIIEANYSKSAATYLNCLYNLAEHYRNNFQFQKSIGYYNELISLYIEGHSKYAAPYCKYRNNLAMSFRGMGDYQTAFEILQEVNRVADSILPANDISRLTFKNNQALLYTDLGNYAKASEIYRELLKYAEIEYGQSAPQTFSLNIGLVYSYRLLGDIEKALLYVNKIIRLLEDQDKSQYPEYWKILNEKALLYGMTTDFEKALPLWQEAIRIVEVNYGKTHPEYIALINNLAMYYEKLGEYNKAIEKLEYAIELTTQVLGKNHPDLGLFYGNLATIYTTTKQFVRADQYYINAIDIYRKTFGDDHPDTKTQLFNYAIFLSRDQSNNEKVFEIYSNVIESDLKELKEKMSVLDERGKEEAMYLWDYRFAIFQSFIFNYTAESPKAAGCSYNLELATKSIVIQSVVQMRQVMKSNSDSTVLKKYDQWISLRKELVNRYSISPDGHSSVINSIEHRAKILEEELNVMSKGYYDVQSVSNAKWPEIQKELCENEVAVEFSYFTNSNGFNHPESLIYTALVLRPGDEHPHLVYLCEQRQLDSLLYRLGNTEPGFVASLYRGAEIIETSMPSNGHRLYELIWKPIAHLLPEGGTVFFAPSGSLHQIAHAAIPVDENTLLSDKYKLVQLSTTAALLQDDDQNETVAGEIALFGGIEYNIEADELIALSGQHQDIGYQHTQCGIPAGLERSTEAWSYLPGTLTEVEAISSLAAKQNMELKSYTGKEALEERFKEISGKNSPTILHIATHAFFFPDPEKELKNENFMLMGEQQQVFRASDNPLNRAGLLFAGANHTWQGDTLPEGVDDGILTAWEATNVTLTNTRLVTLSACETGLGEVRGSEGVFGLQRAFKAAGAEYLLMSLWKVPDTETAEFMAFFYARLFEGTTITDAFHATQQQMKTQYPTEPYKWAAFILTK